MLQQRTATSRKTARVGLLGASVAFSAISLIALLSHAQTAAIPGQPVPSSARIEPLPAPAFELRDSTGKIHKLSDYDGQVVVLEWIHPECPYVTRHYRAQTMQRLAKKYAEQKVVWLAVNSSHFATAEQMEVWRKRHNLTYPILLDPTGTTGHAYHAERTPHMFVVANGKIAYSGAIDDAPLGRAHETRNYVEKALEQILAGKPVTTPQTAPYGCFVKYAPLPPSR